MNGVVEQLESADRALNATELASILNLSPITVQRMAKRGSLPSFKIGSARRFCAQSIARYLREREHVGALRQMLVEEMLS